MDVLSSVIATMRTGDPRSRRVEFRPPFGRRYVPQPGAGIHIVLQGSCWLRPPSGPPVQLNVGDIVLLPDGQAHGLSDRPDSDLITVDETLSETEQASSCTLQIGPDGPATSSPTCVMVCGTYALDRSRPHLLMNELPEVVCLPARLGHHPQLRAAIDLFGGELEEHRPGAEVIVPALLDVLLLLVLRAWLADQPCDESEPNWAAAIQDPAIGPALDSIHTEPERPWTVESLGALVGLSRAAFARRFTALLGQPPLAYVTWWRMTAAARLLRTSDLSLSMVAQQVGYTSEFAFANAFKREFGGAPGQYRRGGPSVAEGETPLPPRP